MQASADVFVPLKVVASASVSVDLPCGAVIRIAAGDERSLRGMVTVISIAAAVKIHVCVAPTDMRKGFDGLCGLAEHVMKQDPLSGHLFVFRNRSRDRLKVMYWDNDGLAIWYKRLERGTFQYPFPDRTTFTSVASSSQLDIYG